MNGIIASKVLEYFQQGKVKEVQQSNLTDREKQILELLVKGYSYKEIAASINISVETLNTHVKNIYRKLNVHSRGELAQIRETEIIRMAVLFSNIKTSHLDIR